MNLKVEVGQIWFGRDLPNKKYLISRITNEYCYYSTTYGEEIVFGKMNADGTAPWATTGRGQYWHYVWADHVICNICHIMRNRCPHALAVK